MTERQEHYHDMLQLVRGFMPHNPLEARERLDELVAELDGLIEPTADEAESRALAHTMLASYRQAADAWQAENARRRDAMHAREHAALLPGAPLIER